MQSCNCWLESRFNRFPAFTCASHLMSGPISTFSLDPSMCHIPAEIWLLSCIQTLPNARHQRYLTSQFIPRFQLSLPLDFFDHASSPHRRLTPLLFLFVPESKPFMVSIEISKGKAYVLFKQHGVLFCSVLQAMDSIGTQKRMT
jgi:hypothetical protein